MLGIMLIHISKKGKWYIHCLDWHLQINSLTPDTTWCHQATSHYGSQPLHWASGNSVVIQWQSSVPGIWTPVYIEMPLEKELLVASVSSALPAAFQWSSSVFQLCKLTLDCHWDHSQHRISAGGSLLSKRCVSLTLTRLLSAWRQGESFLAILAKPCCVHNASTVPWTSAGQFGRPRGVRGRPWYDLWRPRCVISHPMDVRGLPPGRPPSGRPRDTQFGIDWSLLPSGCPQGVRTAEVQPITARTHYGQEVGLPTVRPKPEVDVP